MGMQLGEEWFSFKYKYIFSIGFILQDFSFKRVKSQTIYSQQINSAARVLLLLRQSKCKIIALKQAEIPH